LFAPTALLSQKTKDIFEWGNGVDASLGPQHRRTTAAQVSMSRQTEDMDTGIDRSEMM